jgi:ribose transport system substrate-binding protein
LKILRAVAAFSAALALAGCGGREAGPKTLAYVTNNASDFWTIARKGCEKADAELADDAVEFRIPADGTAAEQRRIVDDLLAKGAAGIAISPVDPANQTQMINDAAARTIVVTHDSDAPSSNRICYVGTDNVAAGRQAAGLIREALPSGGKIMVFVGKLDAQNARERLQGIRDALQGSLVEIVDVRTDDTDRVRAKTNVSDALVKYPEVACLVGLWSYNGPAILNAVRDAGKVGKVRIVCFDEEDETLAGVREGAIDATVVQQPFEFGYQAIRIMATILRGDRTGIPPDKRVIIPTLVVRKTNVEEFSTRINKLRGRA